MQDHNNSYNNADSFAMIFDEAWKKNKSKAEDSLTTEEKIDKIIEENKDHPFIKNSPSEAINVAKFRLRLLELE
tara:strand:+ start:511 stop:732 length:222 start_codon:yes stop_codon:yes gene_type:complete